MTEASSDSKQKSLLMPDLPEAIKSNIDSEKSKFEWYKQRRRYLWAVPLAAALIAVVIVVAVLRPNAEKPEKQDQLPTFSSFAATKGVKRASNIVLSKTIVLSNASPSDFQISNDISELHISSVVDSETIDFPKYGEINPFIRNLTISCQLTEDWMEFIFTKFSQIEDLTFYEDDICNNKLPTNPKKHRLSSTLLPNLETLVVADAKSHCPFIEKVLDSLTASSLRHLKISNSYINYPFFQHFLSLLNNAHQTIETIEIAETYLCPLCEIMSVPFQRLRKLSIRRSKPVMNYK